MLSTSVSPSLCPVMFHVQEERNKLMCLVRKCLIHAGKFLLPTSPDDEVDCVGWSSDGSQMLVVGDRYVG